MKPLFSCMSKRAGESFAASAKQKPVHFTTVIARRLNDKTPDMGHPSRRSTTRLTRPEHFTITATGTSSRRLEATGAASSYGRPEATRDPLNTGEGEVYPQTDTNGEKTSEISMLQQKASILNTRRNENSTRWCCKASVHNLGKTPHRAATAQMHTK